MQWLGRRESGNIVDQRSMGKGTLGIGGLILGAIVYYFMGGNPLVYLSQNAGSVTQSGTTRPASEAEQNQKNFVAVVLADTEDTWTEQFAAAGQTYSAPQLVLFRGSTRSGCGTAGSETGPFYCQRDQRVYLDLGFFDELANSLGAKGDAAAAYVVAHEVGHHVQNLLGLYARAETRGGTRNQTSVAVELQADCLAGVWAAHENKNHYIEAGDIEEAITAAAAVGDDRLQQRSGQEVMPDSFTHGSSAQRTASFRQGFDGGNLKSCL